MTKIKAVIYTRVSTDRQVKEGNGLQSQKKRCYDFCKAEGYEVVAEFEDAGVSGGKYDRPGYLKMLDFLDTILGPKIVVADAENRVTRNFFEVGQIIKDLMAREAKLGGPGWKYDPSPDGELTFLLNVLIGHHQRRANKQLIRNRTTARVSSGYRSVGGCALGYRTTDVRGLHEPYEPVASVIKEILEGYATGRFNNYKEMERFLNAKKLPKRETRKHAPDAKKTKRKYIELKGDKIKRQVLEKAWYYAGFIENGALGVDRVSGLHEPIISVETMEKIERRLSGKGLPVYNKERGKDEFPLRQFMTCAHCGHPMGGAFSKGCGGGLYGYYFCRQKGCHGRGNINFDIVHNQFKEMLRILTPAEELIDFAQDVFLEVWEEEKKNSKILALEYKKQVIELENKIQQHLDELMAVSCKEIKKLIQDRIGLMTQEKTTLQAKLDNSSLAEEDFGIVLSSVNDVLRQPCNLWKEGDIEEKLMIQQLVFPNRVNYDAKAKNFRKPEKALVFSFLEELTPKKDRMVLLGRIELPTSSLPMTRSTTELQQHTIKCR